MAIYNNPTSNPKHLKPQPLGNDLSKVYRTFTPNESMQSPVPQQSNQSSVNHSTIGPGGEPIVPQVRTGGGGGSSSSTPVPQQSNQSSVNHSTIGPGGEPIVPQVRTGGGGGSSSSTPVPQNVEPKKLVATRTNEDAFQAKTIREQQLQKSIANPAERYSPTNTSYRPELTTVTGTEETTNPFTIIERERANKEKMGRLINELSTTPYVDSAAEKQAIKNISNIPGAKVTPQSTPEGTLFSFDFKPTQTLGTLGIDPTRITAKEKIGASGLFLGGATGGQVKQILSEGIGIIKNKVEKAGGQAFLEKVREPNKYSLFNKFKTTINSPKQIPLTKPAIDYNLLSDKQIEVVGETIIGAGLYATPAGGIFFASDTERSLRTYNYNPITFAKEEPGKAAVIATGLVLYGGLKTKEFLGETQAYKVGEDIIFTNRGRAKIGLASEGGPPGLVFKSAKENPFLRIKYQDVGVTKRIKAIEPTALSVGDPKFAVKSGGEIYTPIKDVATISREIQKGRRALVYKYGILGKEELIYSGKPYEKAPVTKAQEVFGRTVGLRVNNERRAGFEFFTEPVKQITQRERTLKEFAKARVSPSSVTPLIALRRPRVIQEEGEISGLSVQGERGSKIALKETGQIEYLKVEGEYGITSLRRKTSTTERNVALETTDKTLKTGEPLLTGRVIDFFPNKALGKQTEVSGVLAAVKKVKEEPIDLSFPISKNLKIVAPFEEYKGAELSRKISPNERRATGSTGRIFIKPATNEPKIIELDELQGIKKIEGTRYGSNGKKTGFDTSFQKSGGQLLEGPKNVVVTNRNTEATAIGELLKLRAKTYNKPASEYGFRGQRFEESLTKFNDFGGTTRARGVVAGVSIGSTLFLGNSVSANTKSLLNNDVKNNLNVSANTKSLLNNDVKNNLNVSANTKSLLNNDVKNNLNLSSNLTNLSRNSQRDSFDFFSSSNQDSFTRQASQQASSSNQDSKQLFAMRSKQERVNNLPNPKINPFPFGFKKPRGESGPMKAVGLGEDSDEDLGFYGEVKDKGKWLRVTKKPLTKEQARALAAKVVDETTAVSLRLIASKQKAQRLSQQLTTSTQKFRDYSFRGKKRTPLANFGLIENKGSRIDSMGEKQQLSASKYLKNKGLFGTFRKRRR